MAKNIVILGSGESAIGTAILAKKKGLDIFLSDNNSIKTETKNFLLNNNISFEENGHTSKVFLANEIIKSPGIPETAQIIKDLRSKNKHIISEIEFALRYSKSKIIGITGANGKTTTTLLTHHLLTSCGINARLAGNIGNSLAREIAKDEQPDWYVVELSSFQLDGMFDSRLDIAILTNITPDHLDRYDHKFENYIAAKFRIVQNQTKEQFFIYNEDDPVTKEYLPKFSINSTCIPINTKNLPFDPKILPIKGRHNIYNALQAFECALSQSISRTRIVDALKTFKNASHRLEFVRNFEGVDYINDSKATNVDSAWYALEYQTKPVIWIAGGTDKGNDYSSILPLVKEKVKALVCLGKENEKLIDFFSSSIKVYDTHSIEECVETCHSIATLGDVVLLSPCCASFDLFNSYIHRGNVFKECVNKL